MNTEQPKSSLEGIRVLDMTRVVAGPWCSMMLADLGADVMKIESPDGGDYTRHWGTAMPHGERPYFMACNRGKRSIAIDYSKTKGRDLLHAMTKQADVFVENYKGGVLAKHGLDYETLSAINPALIYCSISGYGRTGPMATRAGYDPVIQGESGLMSVTGEVDGRPMKVGVPLVDIMSGMYAAQAVTAALLFRSRTGKGQAIDISLFDCMIGNMGSVAANALLLNKAPLRYGNAHADVVPFEVYPTKDGNLILAAGTDQQFQKLCRVVLQRTDLADDPRYAANDGRMANRVELDQTLSECFEKHTREHWLAALEAAGVPAGSVRDAREALFSPESIERGMVCEVDHPLEGKVKIVGSPLKMSESPVVAPTSPPMLGQHTDEILRGLLKLTDAQLAELRAAGVVA